jgi:2-amino-4-hydroxy-6-hydroxymethyldihydropteridine diphosphokinase
MARNWFLNGVVELVTELDAKELLKQLQKIETTMGRKRDASKTSISRVIDLDILLYDRETIASKTLKVPHPEIPNRRFVLLPLSELVPSMVHPILSATVSALLVTSKDKTRCTLFKH